MVFEGKIVEVFGIKSGTHANGQPWRRKQLVIEYGDNPLGSHILSVLRVAVTYYDSTGKDVAWDKLNVGTEAVFRLAIYSKQGDSGNYYTHADLTRIVQYNKIVLTN